nr:hypothetical protein [Gammaproteobacteria bacterium]
LLTGVDHQLAIGDEPAVSGTVDAECRLPALHKDEGPFVEVLLAGFARIVGGDLYGGLGGGKHTRGKQADERGPDHLKTPHSLIPAQSACSRG